MKRQSIARQLVASILLIVVSVLVCSAVAYRLLLNRNFSRLVAEEIAAGREAVRLKVSERTQRAQLIAHFVATDPRVRAAVGSPGVDPDVFLEGYKHTELDADILTLLDRDGLIVAHVESGDWKNGERNAGPGQHEGEPLFLNPLFAAASAGRSIAGIELCMPEVVCIEAIEPVYGTDRSGGIIIGYVRAGFVIGNRFADEVKLATGTDFLLLRRGRGQAVSLSGEKFTPDDARRLADAISVATDGRSRHRMELAGGAYLLESEYLNDPGGRRIAHQVIARGAADIALAEREATYMIAAVAALGLLLAGGLSVFTARRIFGPLETLLGRVREITAGRLDAQVSAARNDELGELAAAFNEMAVSLGERDRRLRDGARELQRRQDQIIQSGKLAAIGELAAGVAHEVGNPLSAISGYAQMIQESQHSPERQSKFAAEIERETEFIERIIHNLLEFSRPSEDEKQAANPRELAETAVRTASAHKAFSKVKIEQHFAPDIPEILCHPKEIQQVFLNLIMNAAQSMPEGGKVSVEGELRPDCVMFRVRDEGQGVPSDIRDKIFDPFFTTKPPGVGTGLGLAITYRIVEKHGGSINLEETLRGASFVFTLPVGGLNK